MYILVKIKSCIDKPVERNELILSPNFEFPVSGTGKEEDEEVSQ